jgi:hypothetical protein
MFGNRGRMYLDAVVLRLSSTLAVLSCLLADGYEESGPQVAGSRPCYQEQGLKEKAEDAFDQARQILKAEDQDPYAYGQHLHVMAEILVDEYQSKISQQ